MVKFMDRFSDFFIKWYVNPSMVFGVLRFILDTSLCQSDRWLHLIIFIAGIEFYWSMQFLPKKHPDLEHLEDESDGR